MNQEPRSLTSSSILWALPEPVPCCKPAAELAWLKREFHLSDTE